MMSTCGVMINNSTGKRIPVVTGGVEMSDSNDDEEEDSSLTRSTELLLPDSNQWTYGPELPFQVGSGKIF